MLIVTRHRATVRYLIEAGIAPATARVVDAATADDVRGEHVIGFLPLNLAALAATVTTVPLPRPSRDAKGRLQELTLDEIRQGAGAPVTYIVRAQPQKQSAEKTGDRATTPPPRSEKKADCASTRIQAARTTESRPGRARKTAAVTRENTTMASETAGNTRIPSESWETHAPVRESPAAANPLCWRGAFVISTPLLARG